MVAGEVDGEPGGDPARGDSDRWSPVSIIRLEVMVAASYGCRTTSGAVGVVERGHVTVLP